MTIGKALAVAAGAALVLSITVLGAEAKSIKTKKAFMAAIVGKQLMSGNNTLVLSSSGKIDGIIGGNPIKNSEWSWKGSKFCRTLATKAKSFPSACQSVSLEGQTVTFGGKSRWDIK